MVHPFLHPRRWPARDACEEERRRGPVNRTGGMSTFHSLFLSLSWAAFPGGRSSMISLMEEREELQVVKENLGQEPEEKESRQDAHTGEWITKL